MNAKFDTTYRAWPLGTLFFWDSVSLFIKVGSLETEPHNGYSMNTITRKDFFIIIILALFSTGYMHLEKLL